MTKDYLIFQNGQKFRIEANWNSLVSYSELKGIEDLNALGDVSKIRPADLTALIWACVSEGERLDGNAFAHTIESFGSMLKPAHIRQFMAVFVKQMEVTDDSTPQQQAPQKKRGSLFRRKS